MRFSTVVRVFANTRRAVGSDRPRILPDPPPMSPSTHDAVVADFIEGGKKHRITHANIDRLATIYRAADELRVRIDAQAQVNGDLLSTWEHDTQKLTLAYATTIQDLRSSQSPDMLVEDMLAGAIERARERYAAFEARILAGVARYVHRYGEGVGDLSVVDSELRKEYAEADAMRIRRGSPLPLARFPTAESSTHLHEEQQVRNLKNQE